MGLSGSDREYPMLTGRSGMQRARRCPVTARTVQGMAPYPGQARCLAPGFWPECFRRLNVKGGRRPFPEETRSALDIDTAVVVRNLGHVVAGHGRPSRGHHSGPARRRHCRFSPGMSFRCGSAAFSSICRGRSSRVLDAFLGEAAGRLTGGSPSFRRAVLRNLTETWPDFRNSLFCDRLVTVG
jgi:hypothetical protein